jgi:hypothetical protein
LFAEGLSGEEANHADVYFGGKKRSPAAHELAKLAADPLTEICKQNGYLEAIYVSGRTLEKHMVVYNLEVSGKALVWEEACCFKLFYREACEKWAMGKLSLVLLGPEELHRGSLNAGF